MFTPVPCYLFLVSSQDVNCCLSWPLHLYMRHSIMRSAVICCQMAIVFNEAGLADVDPPCVVQSFVNHNARVFKIFIVGSRHFVVQRPSIRNCYPGGLCSVVFCVFHTSCSMEWLSPIWPIMCLVGRWTLLNQSVECCAHCCNCSHSTHLFSLSSLSAF